MILLSCHYLERAVELSDERYRHIVAKHPDLLPEHFDKIEKTLADPDEIRRDVRFPRTYLFSRWYDGIRGGKFIAVGVVTDPPPSQRCWVVTAYMARKVVQGESVWKRH